MKGNRSGERDEERQRVEVVAGEDQWNRTHLLPPGAIRELEVDLPGQAHGQRAVVQHTQGGLVALQAPQHSALGSQQIRDRLVTD